MPDKYLIEYDSHAQRYSIYCIPLGLHAYGATMDTAIENMRELFTRQLFMRTGEFLIDQKRGK